MKFWSVTGLMYGDELLFQEGDSVAKGQQLATFDPYFQKNRR